MGLRANLLVLHPCSPRRSGSCCEKDTDDLVSKWASRPHQRAASRSGSESEPDGPDDAVALRVTPGHSSDSGEEGDTEKVTTCREPACPRRPAARRRALPSTAWKGRAGKAGLASLGGEVVGPSARRPAPAWRHSAYRRLAGAAAPWPRALEDDDEADDEAAVRKLLACVRGLALGRAGAP